ncbi:MAG: hypothetical protein IKP07_05115 [Bacilli bacterium]|nr:hypothetical protein [Bacilli bacterium]
MYKIENITENDPQRKILMMYSGYCMINLIANRMDKPAIPVNDNMVVDNSFVEYDYGNFYKRQPNEYYIDAADRYVQGSRKR